MTRADRGADGGGKRRTSTPGQLHRPALERAAFDRPRQDDVGGLIEGGAHRTVAHLADPAADIGLTRLILFRSEPKMCPHRL